MHTKCNFSLVNPPTEGS